MKKETRATLKLVGMEIFILVILGGPCFALWHRLRAGEAIITNRYGFNVPTAGAIISLAGFGLLCLVLVPYAFFREKNMSKAEHKRRRRRDRSRKQSWKGVDLPWQ